MRPQPEVPVKHVARRLAEAEEPHVRYKILVNVLGRDPQSKEVRVVRDEVRDCETARILLAERDVDGRIPLHPYDKWRGAHWVLSCLADLGYAAGDPELIPLGEQVLNWLFSAGHCQDIRRRQRHGRCYWHASIEGNALYYLLLLEIHDQRLDELARRLIEWQWPDGGWNCDLKSTGKTSSFTETLLPLRGLALHAQRTGSPASRQAVERAAEVFLCRRLFRRRRDDQVIRADFTALHYPCYWHYDILFALKVMMEAGYLGDPRCREALELLKSKQLPDGGFPAERKYYQVGRTGKGGDSLVNWGGTSKNKTNLLVTADALGVLQSAGERF